MGQKVNPVGLRVGVNRDWDSKWYASDKEFATFLHEDIKVRELPEKTSILPTNHFIVEDEDGTKKVLAKHFKSLLKYY